VPLGGARAGGGVDAGPRSPATGPWAAYSLTPRRSCCRHGGGQSTVRRGARGGRVGGLSGEQGAALSLVPAQSWGGLPGGHWATPTRITEGLRPFSNPSGVQAGTPASPGMGGEAPLMSGCSGWCSAGWRWRKVSVDGGPRSRFAIHCGSRFAPRHTGSAAVGAASRGESDVDERPAGSNLRRSALWPSMGIAADGGTCRFAGRGRRRGQSRQVRPAWARRDDRFRARGRGQPG